MTRVIYNTATTLNGFLADENNSLDWLFTVPSEGAQDPSTFTRGMGVLVEGSTTYEWVLREAQLLENPGDWQKHYGDRPTFVFTSRELPVPEGADVRFVSGAVADALPAIRAAAGTEDIWLVGGGELAGQFADAGALHRILLSVAPATLSSGAPLLPRALGADRLHLSGVERHGQFATLSYDVLPPAAPATAPNAG